MAAENKKLDMSLDDIIQMDGIKGARRFGGGGGGGRRGGDGQNRRFNNGGGGGGGPERRGRNFEPKRLQNSSGPYHNRNRNAGGGRSFGGNDRSYGGRSIGGGGGGRPMNGSINRRQATLHVSNLATSVSTEDIDELFSTFGVLVRSMVHYDQYGGSTGTAEVVFEHRSDAYEARNKLNSVPLDGKPLRISIIDGDDNEANDPFSNYLRQATQRTDDRSRNGGGDRRQNGGGSGGRNYNNNNNNRNNNRSGGGGGGGNRSGGGGGGGNRRNNGRTGPPPSAEDLDREMDEWRMSVDQVGDDSAAPAVSGGAEDGEFDI